MFALSGVPLAVRVNSQRRHHPEWWLLGLIGVCWVVLAARHIPTADHGDMADPRMDTSGAMAPDHVHPEVSVSDDAMAHVASLPAFFTDWSVMTVAMMVPLTIPVFRHIAFNSFRSRQRRSTAIFLIAYCAVWLGVGGGVIALERLLSPLVSDRDLTSFAPALFLMAALWQVTPWKRRAINACRLGVPLRPFGFRADLSCARYGLFHGWRCVKSCWLLMVAMVAVGHGPVALLVMIGLTAIAITEELVLSRRQFLRRSAGLLVATSFLLLVV